jgi:hypothetical protein
MNDCSNAEIRDRLPDLLHERLSVSARTEVESHVGECVDCRDELELLRGVRTALVAQAPRVDIAYVVGALPKPAARSAAVPFRTARPRWADWRIAAAVTLLVAGGGSVALLSRGPNAVDQANSARTPSATTPSIIASTAGNSSSAATQNSVPGSAPASASIAATDDQEAIADAGPDGRFAGLDDGQLKVLLGEIDRLQAVPVTEPEPVTIRVDLANSTRPDGA